MVAENFNIVGLHTRSYDQDIYACISSGFMHASAYTYDSKAVIRFVVTNKGSKPFTLMSAALGYDICDGIAVFVTGVDSYTYLRPGEAVCIDIAPECVKNLKLIGSETNDLYLYAIDSCKEVHRAPLITTLYRLKDMAESLCMRRRR